MWRKVAGSSDEEASRARRVAKRVDDLARRRGAGSGPTDSAILQQHAELMPEKGKQMHLLRTIQEAASQAKQAPPPIQDLNEATSPFEESRRFLAEALTGYEILEGVQYGGQGVVHKAFQVAARRVVAIKVLLDGPLASDRQRRRFEREVELVSRLRHPNIVTIYDAGLVRGRQYCAMEFIDGLTIEDYVLVEDLAVEDAVRLFVKVCRAVNYAHQHGVIHRDLNPANILVDLDGEPHVLDFGLAKDTWALDGEPAFSGITVAGQCVGTLPYLSPEQAGGFDGQVDVRTDIYSLGVTLFKLVTGMFPYPVQGDTATVRNHIISTEAVPLRRAVSLAESDAGRGGQAANQDLETIVAKSLAKDKERRYQSAGEFADDLQRYLAGDAIHARASSRFYLFRKTLCKHRGLVAAAALFLIVLVGSAVAVTTLWIQARGQRENARAVARVAHSALGGVVTEIEEAIRPLAGGIEVRDRLLDGVANNLDRLRPLIESDATMEDVLATLREKQGDIAAAQGRTGEAERHYEAFLAFALQSVHSENAPPESLSFAARAYRKLAGVSRDPAPQYLRAIELGQQAINCRGDAADSAYELCRTRIDFGRFLCDRGEWDTAAAQIEQALPIAQVNADQATTDLRWGENLATACALNGRIKQQLGSGAAARLSLEEALAIRERMSRQMPANAVLRHQLLLSHVRLSELHDDAGDSQQARELLGKAVELGEYLVLVDPRCATWKIDLYSALDHLAQLDIVSGNLEEAQNHCDAAVSIAQALVRIDPGYADWQRALASAYSLHGCLRRSQKEMPSALADFTEALSIREALAAAESDSLQTQAELAAACDDLGMCCRLMHEFERALASYQRAYDIRKKLLEQAPTVIQRALDVVLSQTKLATWYLDQRTPEGDSAANGLLDQAEASLHTLRDSGRLAGHEGVFQTWMAAIQKNQKIVFERTKKRSSAEQTLVSDTPQPTSAPHP